MSALHPQMLSAPDAAAAAALMHPTACTILQQPQPITQQQQTIIQQQPLQVMQPIYGGGMLAGQQLLEALPVSCALPASCPMPMPAMMPQSQPPEQRSIFFAGVTPVIPAETLLALFSQFGPVQSINLFKPWAGSKTSKGCGIVSNAAHAQQFLAASTYEQSGMQPPCSTRTTPCPHLCKHICLRASLSCMPCVVLCLH